LLLPFRFDRGKLFPGNFSYEGIARLKPGVTLAQANADVARMLPIMYAKFPAPRGFGLKLFLDAHIAANLVEKTEAEMLRTKNFGRKTVNDIKEILGVWGLDLGMKVAEGGPRSDSVIRLTRLASK
jgi:hypothetical protein